MKKTPEGKKGTARAEQDKSFFGEHTKTFGRGHGGDKRAPSKRKKPEGI